MTTNTARDNRLRSLFQSTVRGERDLGSNGALFIEAIANQPEPLVCITTIMAQPKGPSCISAAMASVTSLSHLNGVASDFLIYLRHKDIMSTNNGRYLRDIIKAVMSSPAFWPAFLSAFRSGELQEKAQLAFTFLLLQLLRLESDPDNPNPYRPIAEDEDILKKLSNQTSEDGRNLAGQIKKIVVTRAAAPAAAEGPGPGGRHDNDFADFHDIAILPTSDEILCKEPSFLRPSDALEDPQTAETRPALYLDNQFRLLREDMLHEMKEELQGILNPGPTKKKGGVRGLIVEDLTLVDVYCGAENKRTQWGLCFRPKQDIPQLSGFKDAKTRHTFLTKDDRGKKILRHQSLTCLLADNEIVAFPIIYRDEDLLAKNPPIIVLQFAGKKAITKTLNRSKTAQTLRLIFIDTAIFSFEPVLKALQDIRELPLSQELLFWDAKGDPKSTPYPPRVELLNVVSRLKSDPQQDLRSLLSLSKTIKLDKAQGASLISGLTQPLSLIQGPPGTGKSFIGALLAKFIHNYTTETILVVCYTNHALDQFLLDLKDIGIPFDDIVRIGGKFNADTEAMSIQKQKSGHRFSPADHTIIQNTKSDAEACVGGLERAFGRYKQASTRLADSEIMNHLEFEDPDYFDAFQVPAGEGGMIVTGKKGKAVDEFYLLQQWTQNKDAGIFKSHPEVTGNPEKAKIWRMPKNDRQARRGKWEGEILQYIVGEVYDMANAYGRTQIDLSRKFAEKDINVLKSKRIIGCTTTGAAKYKEIIQAASPDVLLVEEAGEILESHVITALSEKTNQIILIGDHKQLRPKVNNYKLTFEKGEGYNLNVSLFERLVLKGYPHEVLEEQHRMRPEISALIRHLTYPDLTDAPRTKGRPNLLGVRDNIVFINHAHPEDESKQLADKRDMGAKSSKQNNFEVEMVIKIVRYLLQQNYKSEDIVILTPYLAQLYLLQAALRKAPETDAVFNDLDFQDLVRAGVVPNTAQGDKKKKIKIRLATIDNYQGEESDIVVASLCRSNPDNDIGFMFSPERLNVLLSRARNSLIVIGNLQTFTLSRKGKGLWSNLVNKLKADNHVYEGFPVVCQRHPSRESTLKEPKEFDIQCPDGGCNQICGLTLSCGTHTCEFKCHATTVDHKTIQCKKVVQEVCQLGHKKPRKCFEPPSPYCKRCAHEAELAQAELRRQVELQEERERQQLEHEKRMKDLEASIAAEQEKIKDKELTAQRATALQQRRADLDAARMRAANYQPLSSFPTPSSTPSMPQPQPSQSPPNSSAPSTNQAPSASTSNSSTPNASQSSQPQSVPPPRPQTPPGNPATMNKSTPEAEWQRQKDVEGANSPAIDAIMAMTGLEEVKRQILRIKDKVDITKRQNTSISDERFNVVFLGNPGTGKTTVAREYAKFLTSNQIVSGPAFLETTGARLVYEGVQGMEKLINDALKAGGGVIFVDEAYQLTGSGSDPLQGGSQQGSQVLDFMLAEMENRTGQIVFVLAGYAKQMEKFFMHNPGLPSRVPYTLKFTDYTDAELRLMLERRIIKKYNGQMKVEDGLAGLYIRIAVRRLGRGRGREGFGNARALQNMFDKISERQAERVNRERREGKRSDDFFLSKEDVIGPDPSKAILKSAAWAELQKLTGLRSVKDSVKSLMDMIGVNYKRELQEKEPLQMSLNKVFLGSPGTGKTTVGKLYGRILADIGLLSNGEVVVKNPADFKGAYLGQSEKNTKQILDSTIGKVLIIDEAYMLYGGGGSNSTTDIFNTAVIDTMVAEVQNVPGEDRCILLLGYEDKMREMFQNVNEGFSRRFAIEDAFKFEDFTEPELLEIMEGKLKKQDLLATSQGKKVGLEVLAREKTRPNFGNGGAVENLLTASKGRYLARMRAVSPRPSEVTLEPQDFDPDYDRYLRSDQSLDKLFEDVVGAEEVVKKLREYQKVARVKKARNEDPRDVIPTNFVFKGPPGTGKTTTARKIGQVYYDMGFLSSNEVIECSASDLVGQYVGQTGPKTKKLFEKALGKVLFIDEAYRLSQGPFAQEAIDEVVGLVTHETFKGKLIIILAGYDADMDQLMSINSGLNSRFPEVVYFRNFKPSALLEILDKKLRKDKITLDDLSDPKSQGYTIMVSVLEDLSALPGWGNAREIETLAKRMANFVLMNSTDDPASQPSMYKIQSPDAIQIMSDMLDEMRSRSGLPRQRRRSFRLPVASSSSGPPPPPQAASATSSAPPPAPPPPSSSPPPPAAPPKPQTPPPQAPPSQPPASRAKGKGKAKNQKQPPRPESATSSNSTRNSGPNLVAASSSGPQRDAGVSDQVWNQLQADIQAAAVAAKRAEKEIQDAARKKNQAEKDERARAQALQAALKAEKEARDAVIAQELRKKRELAEKARLAAEQRLKALADALKAKRELEKKKQLEEQRRQQKLRTIGKCPQGYPWHEQAGGYRCGGGSHFVTRAQLGLN